MLFRSNQYILMLLPALPAAWNTGEVTGLRARGGFVVDINWEDGKLVDCKIKSLLGNDLKVNYGGRIFTTNTEKGETYHPDTVLN